jgi:hypothetical protein
VNSNVTVKNVCVLDPSGDGYNDADIYNASGASNTIVEYTTAGATVNNDASGSTEAAFKNWSGNTATLSHDYLYYCGECIHDGHQSVYDTYAIANGMDNSIDHREVVYNSDSPQVYNHDTLFLPPENTPQVAVFFDANDGSLPNPSSMTMTNSLIAGGDDTYELYTGSSNTIQNNHYARCTTGPITDTSDGGQACNGYTGSSSNSDGNYFWDSHGYWPNVGVAGVCSTYGSGITFNESGNVYDDNGSSMTPC